MVLREQLVTNRLPTVRSHRHMFIYVHTHKWSSTHDHHLHTHDVIYSLMSTCLLVRWRVNGRLRTSLFHEDGRGFSCSCLDLSETNRLTRKTYCMWNGKCHVVNRRNSGWIDSREWLLCKACRLSDNIRTRLFVRYDSCTHSCHQIKASYTYKPMLMLCLYVMFARTHSSSL